MNRLSIGGHNYEFKLFAKATRRRKKWYVVDAADKPLGRVAATVASILRGKHLPTFTPNVDCGDHVIVINADKIILTGNKLNQRFVTTTQAG